MQEEQAQRPAGAPATPSAPPTLPPELRASPPTIPGPLARPPRDAGWPGVFGILSIVLGALAILQGIFGVAGVFLTRGMFGITPGGAQMQASMDQMIPWNVGVQAGTSLVGVINLLAGVWLVQRRVRGVTWLRTWALVKILFAVLSTTVGYYVQVEMMTAIQQSSTTPVPPPSIMNTFTASWFVVILLWSWVYPVTALVWFARPAIRAQVQEWEDSQAGTMPAGATDPER